MKAAQPFPTLIAAALLLVAAASAPSSGAADAAPREKKRTAVADRQPVKDQDSVAPAPVVDDSPITPALAPASGANAADTGAHKAKRRVAPRKKSTN
jgi:hypothetical protein